MFDYSKLNEVVCLYEDMLAEMEKGIPRELAEHILIESDPFDIGGKTYVNREKVDKCAREILGMKKPGRQSKDADTSKADSKALKKAQAENQSLKNRIGELEKQVTDAGKDAEEKLKSVTDRLSESEKSLNALNNAYNEMFEKKQSAEAEAEKEKNARISSDRRIAELEQAIEVSDREHYKTVTNLNGQITDLKKQCADARKMADDPDMKTSKSGLKQDLKEARKNLEDKIAELERIKEELRKAQEDNEALKNGSSAKKLAELSFRAEHMSSLYAEKQAEYEELELALEEEKEKTSKAREEARSNREKAERLQSALDQSKASGKNGKQENGNTSFAGIDEYYKGEISDFIGYLARQRLASLPDEDGTTYRRERAICEQLSEKFPDSGTQKTLSADIADAVKLRVEKNSDAGLRSLGFEKEASNSHDKYLLSKMYGEGMSSRCMLIMARTPSDHRSTRESTATLRRMLMYSACGNDTQDVG